MVNFDEIKKISATLAPPTAPTTATALAAQIGTYRQDWQFLSLLKYIEDTHNLLRGTSEQENKASPASVKSFQLMQCFKQAAHEYYKAVHEVLELVKAEEETKAAEKAEAQNGDAEEKKTNALNYDYERASALRKINTEWLGLASLVQSSELAKNQQVQLLERIVMGISDTLPPPPKTNKNTPSPRLGPKSDAPVPIYVSDASTLHRGDTILPLFGSKFEMRHFIFAPNIKVLAMPTHALYAPWRWSVIWHEVAGIIMRQEHTKPLIDELLTVIKEAWWKKWEPEGEYYGQERDAESDESFVVKVVYSLPNRRGWVEEMLEDAFSVLALGKPTLQIMYEVLAEYYPDLARPDDERHPAPAVRLELAYQLLKLMGVAPDEDDVAKIRLSYHKLPKFVEDPTIKDIAKWIFKNRGKLIDEDALAGDGSKFKSQAVSPAVQARQAFISAFESFRAENLQDASANKDTIRALFDRVNQKVSEELGASANNPLKDDWELSDEALKDHLALWMKAIETARKQPTVHDQLKALKALHFVEVDALLNTKVESHTHPQGNLGLEGFLEIFVKGDTFHETCVHDGRTLKIYKHTHNFDAATNEWFGFNFRG